MLDLRETSRWKRKGFEEVHKVLFSTTEIPPPPSINDLPDPICLSLICLVVKITSVLPLSLSHSLSLPLAPSLPLSLSLSLSLSPSCSLPPSFSRSLLLPPSLSLSLPLFQCCRWTVTKSTGRGIWTEPSHRSTRRSTLWAITSAPRPWAQRGAWI